MHVRWEQLAQAACPVVGAAAKVAGGQAACASCSQRTCMVQQIASACVGSEYCVGVAVNGAYGAHRVCGRAGLARVG